MDESTSHNADGVTGHDVDRPTNHDVVEPMGDVADLLRGTSWNRMFPGSGGDLLVWFTFGASTLSVVDEWLEYQSGSVIRWADPDGTWAVDESGLVSVSWRQYRAWDDSYSYHTNRWSYTVIDGALKDRVYADSWVYVQDETMPYWSDAAMRSVDDGGARYFGEWSGTRDYPEGAYYRDSRSIEVSFNAPPAEGQPCEMNLAISIMVQEAPYGVLEVDAVGSERFRWMCTVTRSAVDGLLVVQIDGDWTEDLVARGLSDDVFYPMYYGFNAPLYLDPDDRQMIVFARVFPASEPGPLIVQSSGTPPS